VRLQQIVTLYGQLLGEVAGQISNRLDAAFTELPGSGNPNIGVELTERGARVVMEIPEALLARAGEDASAREAIRIRIKARRDRMLFRPRPAPLPKRITSVVEPGGPPFGRGRR